MNDSVRSPSGDPLKVAVIGAGAIAINAHLPAWAARGDVSLECVVDRDVERARAAAERFGAHSWSADHRDLLVRGDLDAVDICTLPSSHRQIAVDFLGAGVHVLLEKPFATDPQDAQAVIDAEAKSGKVLMIAENWPFASAVTRVRRALDEGRLGEPYMIRAHHESRLYDFPAGALPDGLGLAQAGGGLTMGAGIHAINLARHFLGEITDLFAYAIGGGGGPQPWVERDVVLCGRSGDRLISMNFTGRSRLASERRISFALFGTEGVAEFEMLSGSVTINRPGESRTESTLKPSMGYAEEIDHFCRCVRGDASVLTSATDQMNTIRAVLAAYRSMHTQRPESPSDIAVGPSSQTCPTASRGHLAEESL